MDFLISLCSQLATNNGVNIAYLARYEPGQTMYDGDVEENQLMIIPDRCGDRVETDQPKQTEHCREETGETEETAPEMSQTQVKRKR